MHSQVQIKVSSFWLRSIVRSYLVALAFLQFMFCTFCWNFSVVYKDALFQTPVVHRKPLNNHSRLTVGLLMQGRPFKWNFRHDVHQIFVIPTQYAILLQLILLFANACWACFSRWFVALLFRCLQSKNMVSGLNSFYCHFQIFQRFLVQVSS